MPSVFRITILPVSVDGLLRRAVTEAISELSIDVVCEYESVPGFSAVISARGLIGTPSGAVFPVAVR